GDSGSGVYTADKKHFVAIHNSHLDDGAGNLVIRLDYYLADICRVTGVCAQGVDEAVARQELSEHIKFDKMLNLCYSC
ncbi:hypothetical protein AAVH_36071, partial [Aphelenchoides avenae]